MSEILHIHHINPKHATGGVANNHPDNLVQLTILDHAIFHKVRYHLDGDWQDNLAWKTLSGLMNSAEATRIAQRLANTGDRNPLRRSAEARRKHKISLTGRKLDQYHIEKIRATSIFCTDKNPGKNPTEETRKRMSISQSVPKPWMSERNKRLGILPPSQKNTIWITDGIINKKISNDIELPDGYRKGMK